MTRKTKEYEYVKFPYLIISEALKTFHKQLRPKDKKYYLKDWSVDYSGVSWKYDNEEQFRSEYGRDEITRAGIHLHTEQASISIAYSKNYKSTSTITVECSNIDKIEAVFSVFEKNYEKFQEKPKESKDGEPTKNALESETPFPQYDREIILPSTLIDIKAIANLEKYIAQRVSQLDVNIKPTLPGMEYLMPAYKLTVSDSQGKLEMRSISLFSRDMFDNDTSSINLSYGRLLGSNTLAIDIKFTRERYNSTLKISYKGENAREIVEGIKIGILNVLQENKTSNSFYHSIWLQIVLIFLMAIAITGSLRNFVPVSPDWWVFLIPIILGLFIMNIAPRVKPYTVFDSMNSRSNAGWNKFLVEAIIGAFIAWALFNVLIPNILPLP